MKKNYLALIFLFISLGLTFYIVLDKTLLKNEVKPEATSKINLKKSLNEEGFKYELQNMEYEHSLNNGDYFLRIVYKKR